MEDRKLQRLKEVLSIPTHSRHEELMIAYLENVLTEKGYDYKKDGLGNIYVTKGEAEFFPCFVITGLFVPFSDVLDKDTGLFEDFFGR